MKKRIITLLLCLLMAFSLSAGMAEDASGRVDGLAGGILAFKAAQAGAADIASWVENALPDTMGTGGEWYAIALNGSEYDLSACHQALADYPAAHSVRAAATRQKLVLALSATGDAADAAEFTADTLSDTIGQQGVMSWVWGLHLLQNGFDSPSCTTEEAVKTLLSLQRADGGWAVTGDTSDVDVTAMVLQALAPDRAECADAVSRALDLLSARQLENGGFASYGVENAESTAQVIIALCALDIDPLTDMRFIREGETLLDVLARYRLADGSFSHVAGGAYSETATIQAFLAVTACQRLRDGAPALYHIVHGADMPGELHAAWSYKAIGTAVIAAMAAVACAVLLLQGKRHPKSYLAVGIAAALLLTVLLLTDIQPAADFYAVTALEKSDTIGQVRMSIRCDVVAGQAAHIPADGVILADTEFPIALGDTAYTLLTDAARAFAIHMESSGTTGMMYVQGIGNVYEFDFGDLSGWMYLVNGEAPSVGCDQCVLAPGDVIEWRYTRDLGRDF